MPIHIRTFYIQQLVKTKEEEKKQVDKATKKPSGVVQPNIPRR